MKSSIWKLGLLFPFLMLSSYVSANEDSSVIAKRYLPYLEASTAAVLRVPLNESGEEMTSSAEMRIYTGEAIKNQGDFNPAEVWNQSVSVGNMEVDASDRVDDNSTFFFFGWRPYRSYYYYPTYYPQYSYGNYGYYYNPYRYYGNYYGHRYYYYPRYYRGAYGYW